MAANRPVLELMAGATVRVHDMKIRNNSNIDTPRAVESSASAYFHDVTAFAHAGESIRVLGGRFFGTQIRASNSLTGISARFGSTFLQNYDSEAVNNAVHVQGPVDSVSWIGGGITGVVTGLRISNDCESVVLQGVTARNIGNFVVQSAGAVRKAAIMGNSVTNATNGIVWTGGLPSAGLSLVGNLLDAPTPLAGFAHTSPRVNSKANVDADGLMSETPSVP